MYGRVDWKLALLALGYIVGVSLLMWWLRTPPALVDLAFGFGRLLQALADGDTAALSLRSPGLISFLYTVQWLGGGTLAALLSKNLLLQPFLLWALLRLLSGSRARVAAIAAVLFALSFPSLVIWSYELVPEEGWLIPILGFLSYQLFHAPREFDRRRLLLIGLAIALALLVKSSMRLFCPMLVLLFVVRARDWRAAPILVVLCLASFATWGAYNHAVSGEVRFVSSLDGYNLYKGNNRRTLAVFPVVEKIAKEVWDEPMPPRCSEWCRHDAYVQKTFDFWLSEPAASYKLFLLRAQQVFISVTPPHLTHRGPADLTLRTVSMLYYGAFRVVFLLCVLYSITRLGGALRRRIRGVAPEPGDRHTPEAAIFLALVLSYCAPYLVGFAFERHILPLVVPTVVFGLWILEHDGDAVRRGVALLIPPPEGRVAADLE